MSKTFSKTQIDRLGERLKKSSISEADLQLLDQYRRSFAEAFDCLVRTIRKELAVEPTGRPAKSTSSIIEKLRRESIRLSQVQDIAGCRLIVPDIPSQETLVRSLSRSFECKHIFDRRQQPSYGYRAVHVIVICFDKMIEIQVRTSLQQLWAELSEKISDLIGSAIKYGGGDEDDRKLLTLFSSWIAEVESIGRQLMVLAEVESLEEQVREELQESTPEVARFKSEEKQKKSVELQKESHLLRQRVSEDLHQIIKIVERFKRIEVKK